MPESPFSQKRNIWQQPWGFAEGFIIAGGIIFTGILLEIATGGARIPLPQWPLNLIGSLGLLLFLLVLYVFGQKTQIIKWLSSISAAISAIVLFTILTLTMGFIPQVENSEHASMALGLDNIRRGWPFLLASLYLLTSLGLVIMRRFSLKGLRNWAFVLSHLGLWLVIFSASIAAGDLQRIQIPIYEGETTQIGYNDQALQTQMPFSLTLHDFRIDEFPAKIALVDRATQMIDTKLKNNLRLAEQNQTYKLGNYIITVEVYFELAEKDSNGGFKISENPQAAQVAKVKVAKKNGEPVSEGWITSGSPLVKPQYVPVDSLVFLAMTLPQPRRFSSQIGIIDSKGSVTETRIEVNKPITIDGWKLYQIGYDTEKGRFSTLSVLEAVRDPWIPVVYIGIFMVIGGALFMFWLGQQTKN